MLTTIETIIGHWVTLIKAHEKLLLSVLAVFALFGLANKATNAYDAYLKSKQTATDAQIATIQKQNTDLQTQLAELKVTFAAQSKIDDAKIAAAKTKVVVQQKIDAALPLPELSAHWESLIALPGSITPQTNGTVAVTTDAAHVIVNQLELIPSLQDQLAATNDKVTQCTALVAKQDDVTKGVQSELALEKTGRAEDAKVAKGNQRKAYLRGLKHGIIIGVVGTVVATVAILH
jgi:hypothetical protein